MKSRLLVAAVGIPLILWAILWAPMVVLEMILALLSGIGAYELMKCVNAHPNWRIGAALAAGLSVALYAIIGQEFTHLLSIIYVICIFAWAVWKAGEVKWQETATAVFSVVLIPYAFAAFLRLYGAGYHRAFLLLPLI